MDKRLTLLVLSLMVAVCMFAQTNATQSINEIKSHPDIYLYAESTSQTWEEALDNAKYLLGVEIETWVKTLDSKPADGYIAEAQNNILSLKSMRGDRFRAFVYVRKSDIMPIANASQLVVVPISEKHKTTITEVSSTQKTNVPEYQPTEFEEEMMSIADARNIEPFIKRFKTEGKIASYGNYSTFPQNANCYIFVHSLELNIVAYLRKEGKSITNVKTGKPDQLSNYEGCGVLWFHMK